MAKYDNTKEIFVRIPAPLAEKDIRAAVGYGLFKVIRKENRPTKIPGGQRVKARIKLSEEAQKIFNDGLPYFSSQNEYVTLALTFIAEQPLYVRNTRI